MLTANLTFFCLQVNSVRKKRKKDLKLVYLYVTTSHNAKKDLHNFHQDILTNGFSSGYPDEQLSSGYPDERLFIRIS